MHPLTQPILFCVHLTVSILTLLPFLHLAIAAIKLELFCNFCRFSLATTVRAILKTLFLHGTGS